MLGLENEILGDNEIIADQVRRNKEKKKKTEPAKTVKPKRKSALRRAMHILISPRKAERVLLARWDREKYEKPYRASQEAVERFKERSLSIRNVSADSLQALNDLYDAFIAGSDQVWSLFENTFNPFFFLDFVTGKKIAYAPCLGTDQIPDNMKQTLQELLADYFAISAREKASAEQLAELTGMDVSWVVDPTILRGRDGWTGDIRDVKNPLKPRYLLCYFLENNPWYFEQAKLIAKKLHLRPALIPSRWEHLSNEHVIRKGIGPLEFVSLFHNADFVLTDSYHGSIFSILFGKGFQYLERFSANDPKSQNMRIHSLFDALGLSGLIVPQNQQAEHAPAIAWPSVYERLEEMQNYSRNYLKHSLSSRGENND